MAKGVNERLIRIIHHHQQHIIIILYYSIFYLPCIVSVFILFVTMLQSESLLVFLPSFSAWLPVFKMGGA